MQAYIKHSDSLGFFHFILPPWSSPVIRVFPVLLLFLLYSSVNFRCSNLPLFAQTSFVVYVWISHSIFRVHWLRKWICTLGCLPIQKEFERHFNQFSLWISSFKCEILIFCLKDLLKHDLAPFSDLLENLVTLLVLCNPDSVRSVSSAIGKNSTMQIY